MTTACVLAIRGWSVQVHERSNELREMGAGIYLKNNSLAVLEELGLLEEIKASGMILRAGRISGRSGKVLANHIVHGIDTVTVARGALHRSLTNRAQGLGVRFRTGSQVTAVDPAGSLTANGERFEADLVVGADGVHSIVRDSLGLLQGITMLEEGGIRVLVPRWPDEREGMTTEQWSGTCRLGIVPCSKDQLYLYLIGPARESGVHTVPVNKKFWCDLFPEEVDVLNRIGDIARYDQFSLIKVKGWSAGRVAIIGDSVHAQPPNLGQGAGMAIANASALGAALGENTDVPTALRLWEESRRPVTEEVQLWSYRYGLIFYALPFNALFGEQIRASIMSMIGRIRYTARKLAWLRHGGHPPDALALGGKT
ncbi:MAG: FAD-dependent monooxygenase [Proteobacteria bacterium]|nr:FAD-dependent monooxygenase [Pseudomonadota bacterium]